MLKRLLIVLYRAAPNQFMNWVANLFQPHFTVTVSAVVIDEKGRVLLLKHNFRGGSRWGFPGGFMEKGEQPESALRREVREEAGIEIENIRAVLARTVTSVGQVQIIYKCDVVGEPKVSSIEIEKWAWFEIEEATGLLSRGQKAILRRIISEKA